MIGSLNSFIDELEKISAQLNAAEKRQQALQFAGLGAVTVPAMAAASNKMMTGKWLPSGVPGKTGLKRFGRWAPAAVATGLFWGGALPSIQHMLAQRNLRKAGDRVESQQVLKKLAPGGVHSAVKQVQPALTAPDPGI